MGGIPFQPFTFPRRREQWPLVRRTHRHGCMAGYHYLMPTAFHSVATKHIIKQQRHFIPLQYNNIIKHQRHFFPCNTIQNLSPFRGSVNRCVLSRGSVLRTSPPACILSCLWHYFIWNANGIDIKNPDKNLSGKSDEREVKMCKTWFFTHHSSFFISRELSSRSAKHKLWPRQRSCFIASNITFHTTKHGLSCSETLPLANSYFVNR